jgi:hypothetical protein
MSRYKYFDANLQPVEGGTAEHVITADTQQNLTFVVDPLGGKEVPADKADKLIAACRLGGFDDWRGPEAHEEFLTRDLTRYSPAMDPIAFPRQPAAGWVWTRTPVAWTVDEDAGGASAARCVHLYDGSVTTVLRGNRGAFVRAVRSGVPAGQ